jgi:acyl-CoA hydrolase
MHAVTDLYRSRLISQEELITRLRPGNSITLGTWMGQPHGFMQALARYGKEIDPLYVSCSPASANGEFLSQPNIRCLSTFLGYYERVARRQRHNVMYTPLQYTDARNSVRSNRPPDYLVVRTAPLDGRGHFNLSLSNSWLQDAISWYARNAPATKIVVEVNPHMPPIRGLPQFGSNEIPLSDVHHVVEDDTPIPDFTTPEPSDVDRAIAANVAALVEDRATIQLGFGTIPMVIGRLLAERKELGIHTEMFCQSHVDLIEAGSVSNAHKGLYDGLSVGTFALGEQRLYRWLTDNPAFAMLPVEETNAVQVLGRVRKMTSINSILTVDLNGQACAHCIGPETYSGLHRPGDLQRIGRCVRIRLRVAVVAGRQEHPLPAIEDPPTRRPRGLQHRRTLPGRYARDHPGALCGLGRNGTRGRPTQVPQSGMAGMRLDRHRPPSVPR